MARKLTTCTFCGVGCGLYFETKGNRIAGAYPSMSHPANDGKICARGWHVHEVSSAQDRLRTPLIKRNGKLEAVSWEEALSYLASRIIEIRKQYGPDAFAFLSSPRCSNEEAYLLQKLARTVIGTNNVDHGTGVYTNNSVDILLKMLGTPATTNSIAELSASDVIFVDGVDLARQMPTIGGAVIRAKLKGATLVVIDPRRHRVAESADIFLQIRPGTETLLYGAMAKTIIDRGYADLSFVKARTDQSYAAFLETTRDYDLLSAAHECGVAADLIEIAALAYARARAAALLYSTGVESRSADTIAASVNLALLCGQLGRPGAGIFALTEHNNLQGVCDMGMLPERLPGYRPVENAKDRSDLEQLWGTRLPAEPGYSARSLLSTRARGRVRALWLCRYDPVSTAALSDAARVLDECDLVVTQHMFLTETAKHAHVVLPTTAFGEEQVTFTSTERRIQLAERVIDPVETITPAWQQLVQIATKLGASWSYPTSAQVMDEIGRAVPFYEAAGYENLSQEFGRQWPCTKEHPLGTRLLLSETADRPLSFIPIARPAHSRNQAYPFTLVFGHSLYYWHRNVLIRHSETLKREYGILLLDYPESFVEINDEDAKRLGIRDGSRIRLRGATGSTVVAARVTPEVRAGTVYVPHFVEQVQSELRSFPGPSSENNGSEMMSVCVEKEAA